MGVLSQINSFGEDDKILKISAQTPAAFQTKIRMTEPDMSEGKQKRNLLERFVFRVFCKNSFTATLPGVVPFFNSVSDVVFG